jgi:hypothetical protein
MGKESYALEIGSLKIDQTISSIDESKFKTGFMFAVQGETGNRDQ